MDCMPETPSHAPELPLPVLTAIATHIASPTDLQQFLCSSRACCSLRDDPQLLTEWLLHWRHPRALPALISAAKRVQTARLKAQLASCVAKPVAHTAECMSTLHDPCPRLSSTQHICCLDAVLDRLLISPGLSQEIEAPAMFGMTPLLLACRAKWRGAILKLLAAGADVRAKSRRGETVLHILCDAGSVDLVEAMLAAGADPSACDSLSRTPLYNAMHGTAAFGAMPAVCADVVHVVRLLLQQPGVDVNAKNLRQGRTWDVPIIAAFLEHADFDVNAANVAGLTLLHELVAAGNLEAIHLLLLHPSLELNAMDNLSRTALHHACAAGQAQAVQELLSCGAVDLTLQDMHGRTAEAVALQCNQLAIAETLRRHAACAAVSVTF